MLAFTRPSITTREREREGGKVKEEREEGRDGGKKGRREKRRERGG